MPSARMNPYWIVGIVSATAVTAAVAIPLSMPDRADVAVLGLPGAEVSPTALRDVVIASPRGYDGLSAALNGEPLPLRRDGDLVRPDIGELPEGGHTLVVTPPPGLFGEGEPARVLFRVDATPPELDVYPPEPVKRGTAGEIRGTAHGAVTVSAGEEQVRPNEDGEFALPIRAGLRSVTVTARDAAGNTAIQEVPVALRHPGMRAVHLTASAWASPTLREPVLDLVREGRIDTIQLDIKDESGQIGYASQVPMAQRIGANTGLYDARAALELLHSEGIHVVGRIVAFRDPVHGRAAWEAGEHDQVVQTSGGSAWSGGYGDYSFTNFADPEVREYNIALAEEAAELGFDDILWDYIRRPDGDVSQMVFPGLDTSPEESIATFLAESRAAIHRHGAFQGASVFGIAASRPTQIAQDIPAMSEHVDYVAPMVYPSHWGPGEYGVEDPESQPYDITARSLAEFQDLARQNGHSKVIPWLQAFSLRVPYGPDEVRAQIEAAEDLGIDSFLLWNAGCRYDPRALAPT
ncbi:putative glycoside hydrolase [Saccharomonospora piscinae]|uniref:putative glycoside hydrolase n=1 Tax=Saccharomonospora piscinae TaxID=687388 RepID=UPI000466E5BC|nr:putative glycoside hydrolase [Saccharomonospora piscinae]